MYCIRCGSQLEDGTRYCIYCGAPTVAVKKERPRPVEDDTASIPIDFFSSRMMTDDQDDFTIRIPDDFIQPPAADVPQMPDEAGDLDFTRMVAKEDILEAMTEQEAEQEEILNETGEIDFIPVVDNEDIHWGAISEQMDEPEEIPDETGEIDFTCIVDKDDIREAMTEQTDEPEEIPDETGEIDFTRVVDKDDIREAMTEQREQPEDMPEINIQDIPDIPIPSDFIVQEDAEFEEIESISEEDDAPEQLMSRRGIIFVVIVVVLLFAIAVGAFVAALRGGEVSGADGSAVEIGFWSDGPEE